jgi:hypothetical protein
MSDEIKQYRKKPVVIEAAGPLTNENVLDICRWCDAKEWSNDPAELKIKTLEGTMIASEGDYIIRGVSGEFYPCKPEIFAKTYDDTALTPAPRVVTDLRLVVTRYGDVCHRSLRYIKDAATLQALARDWDADDGHLAPHRVVRVALVEEGVPEANFGNVPPRVVVLDEWAIVDANGKHVNRIRGGSAEYAKGYAADADRFTPEAAPHATLRVALVEEPTTEAPADDA